MDRPDRSFPRGDLRASDADRDRAVAELSEHFQTGRITQEEFDDRSGRALRSRTGQELSELFTDLPPGLSPGLSPAAASDVSVRGARRLPVGRVLIACAVVAIVAGTVVGTVMNFGHTHTVSLGWLVPIVILGFIFRRHAFGRR
jgi:Domain of unknown function (DUF1707)